MLPDRQEDEEVVMTPWERRPGRFQRKSLLVVSGSQGQVRDGRAPDLRLRCLPPATRSDPALCTGPWKKGRGRGEETGEQQKWSMRTSCCCDVGRKKPTHVDGGKASEYCKPSQVVAIKSSLS